MKRNAVLFFIPLAYGLAFFLGIESGGFQLVLLHIASAFQLSPVAMGALVAVQYGGISLSPLIFGWMADRVGKKTILMIFMPLLMAGCLVAALSGVVAVFIAGVLLIGIGYSVCESIGSAALADSVPGREERHLNIMQCCFGAGAVLSPQVFSRLIAAGAVNWRAVFFTVAAGYLLIYPLLLLSARGGGASPASIPPPEAPPKRKLLSPLLCSLVCSMLLYVAIETGMVFFADSLFAVEYRAPSLGAHAISGFWLAITASRFIFAWTKLRGRTMVLGGFILSCLVLVFMILQRRPLPLLFCFILQGLILGPVWPMILCTGTQAYQHKSGTVASIITASGGAGGALIPVLMGAVAERGSFSDGFWLLAGAALVGFAVQWVWGKQAPASQ